MTKSGIVPTWPPNANSANVDSGAGQVYTACTFMGQNAVTLRLYNEHELLAAIAILLT